MQQALPFGSNSTFSSGGNISRSVVKMEPTKDPFPVGLRVLVVDDDPICLMILQKMLQRCLYEVTTCGEATVALAMLRQNKNRFDLIISDVYMPDMDGFKLLELVGLEMDLPVIMMSADGETSAVMKGITHGACDYLLKPVRMEELRNIWQHVVRKRRNEVKDVEHSGSADDNEKIKRASEDKEYTCSSTSKKRKDVKEEEDDDDHETDDPSALKKPRVVWSVELHQQFVSAVNQLGIDKAVPKRILELMGVQGLTRENVASHLQKYRLYLKRLSVAPHHNAANLPFAGGQESSMICPMSSLDGINELHSLTASSHLLPQPLTSVQSGILSRLGSINGLGQGALDNSVWLQLAALQGNNYGSLGRPRLQTPWLNSPGNIVQDRSGTVELDQLAQTPQSAARQPVSSLDDLAGLNLLQHQISSGGIGGMTPTADNVSSGFSSPGSAALMMHMIQQQQQQQVQSRNVSGVKFPMRRFPGQNIFSGETNQHVVQLPTTGSTHECFNGQVQNLGLNSSNMILNGCVGSRGHPISHEIDNLVSITSVDSKTHSLLGVGASFQALNGTDANSLVAPASLTAAVKESGIAPVNVNGNYKVQVVRDSMLNFSALGNPNGEIGPSSNRPRNIPWQGQNASTVQDFVQASHHFESPVYNHMFNASQSTRQAPVESFELIGTGLKFPRNPESGCLQSPARSACTKSEQSTTDGNFKLKEEWNLDSATTKLESATPILGDSSSDDLLTLILKQQQEMMGFTETDLLLDGYAPEICM